MFGLSYEWNYFGTGGDNILMDNELGSEYFDEVFVLFGLATKNHWVVIKFLI